MTKRRVYWVDICKYICIMSVMNSHLESSGSYLQRFYLPFFLSLFFFCSGYVYHHKDGFADFTKKKIRQLLIPWLIFSVMNILLSQIISFNAHDPLTTELFWNFMQIRGLGDGLWFVAALFVAFFPFYFSIHRYEQSTHKNKVWWLLGTVWLLSVISHIYSNLMDPTLLPWNTTGLPWHLEYMFIAMFYMVMGYLFRSRFEPFFDQYNTVSFRWILWIVYAGLVQLNTVFKLPSYHVLSLLGIAAVICVSKVIPANRLVLYIGQNTLACFALHGKIYSVMQTAFRKLIPDIYAIILSNFLLSNLFSVVFTIVISLILIIPIWILNRWFPFAVGRYPKHAKK